MRGGAVHPPRPPETPGTGQPAKDSGRRRLACSPLGLTVTAEGDRLVVRGPRAAAPIADRLVAAKPAVLAALANRHADLDHQENSVWWTDRLPEGSGPILHLPPWSCIAPSACSRLGPCDRHGAGQACQITTGDIP